MSGIEATKNKKEFIDYTDNVLYVMEGKLILRDASCRDDIAEKISITDLMRMLENADGIEFNNMQINADGSAWWDKDYFASLEDLIALKTTSIYEHKPYLLGQTREDKEIDMLLLQVKLMTPNDTGFRKIGFSGSNTVYMLSETCKDANFNLGTGVDLTIFVPREVKEIPGNELGKIFSNIINIRRVTVIGGGYALKNIDKMFNRLHCKELNLDKFQMMNVTSCNYLFHNASIKKLDLKWFKNIYIRSAKSMFEYYGYSYGNVKHTIDIGNLNLSRCLNTSSMFCSCLADIIDASDKDDMEHGFKSTRLVTNMAEMFKQFKGNIGKLVDDLNMSNVAIASEMFEMAKVNYIDLSRKDLSKLKRAAGMFGGLVVSNLERGVDVSSININELRDYWRMLSLDRKEALKGVQVIHDKERRIAVY